MNLSARILVGLVLGIAVGLFFGELAAPLEVVGQAFILLLQMTVLPYVSLSLVTGLGSLRAEGAARLALRASIALLVLWSSTITVICLIPLAFPSWESASFFSSNLVQEDSGFDFLSLFIPSNPFRSLAESIVPSVVVFSVALGVALIGMEAKGRLIGMLEIITDALSRITTSVVGLAPFGVFAIAANAAGTLSLDQAASLQVYMAVFAGSALVLALWTLPGLVAAVTPYGWRQILGLTRGALITALATGSVFVVLSVIAARSKEIIGEEDDGSGEDAENVVDVVVPVAFTFPSAGKLLSLSFVLFAGWVAGYGLSPAQYPALLAAGIPSFFGATVQAIPFLLDLFQIPSDTFQLFLVADSVVGGRFGAMVAGSHLVAMALLTSAAMVGHVRFQPLKLVRFVLVTLLLHGAVIGGVRLGFEQLGRDYGGYDRFVAMQPRFEQVRWRVLTEPPPHPSPERLAMNTLDRVRARGVLRVGYLKDRLPWTFSNGEGRLVGFDVEMANVLASELGVTLEFLQADFEGLAALLDQGRLDIGMSGIALTTNGLERMSFSRPYVDETIAFITRDHRRTDFGSRASVQSLVAPKIAVPNSEYYVQKLRRYVPTAVLTVVPTPRAFFQAEPGTFDALLYTAESGSAWSLIYPEFTVAVPRPDILKVPLAYAVRRGDESMEEFLSLWIELKRRDRTLDDLFEHWILGRATENRAPRWSVLRDVLGWVE